MSASSSQSEKLQLYSFGTPNGHKIAIMLEELGLLYDLHVVNIQKDQQFEPDFLKISPNNKIPAIVDPGQGPNGQDLNLFESGAILIYLAEKHGQFLSKEPWQRSQTLQWLMFQMGGFGPIPGQAHHFFRAAKEDVPYAKERYWNETKRLYGVMDKHLADKEFFSPEGYSIADIAIYPWMARFEWHRVNLEDHPNVHAYFQRISKRPAVKRAYAIDYGA